MPVRTGGAKLWFKTQEEIDEYDDRMISSIELKSSDFDDENFSPVFDRPKKEAKLELGEKFYRDMSIIKKMVANKQFPEIVDKYHGGKRDHTYHRGWTVDKFISGYFLGYFIFREIPIRNFYARCFIMACFLAKVRTLVPFGSLYFNFRFLIKDDAFSHKDTDNYDFVALNECQILPDAGNRIDEAILWKMKQPSYMIDTPAQWVGTYFPWVLGLKKKRVVDWDGTYTMPLERLGDSMHKDCMPVKFTA